MPPDYRSAYQGIIDLLARELDPALAYHGLSHTTDFVLPAVELLGRDLDLAPEDMILVRTAALFHDSGFIRTYLNNESIGVELARSILPGCGYSPAEIETIGHLILATAMPQRPHDLLAEVLCDADLVSLGMVEFFETSMMLRREHIHFVEPVTLLDWLRRQHRFLVDHRYFTPAARRRYDRIKQENIRELDRVLARSGDTG